MKVLVNCRLLFADPIDTEKLSDATSGHLYGDYASFNDINCFPSQGMVGHANLSGYFENPTRITDDGLEDEVAELVFDLINQYGFPVDVVNVEIKDYCDA